MSNEAYYPNLLPPKKIKEAKFRDYIIDINLELGRFDGMLTYHPKKEIIKAFLQAEEVLSSSWLETREMGFYEYISKLLNRDLESEDMSIMKLLTENYNQLLPEHQQTFSLDFLANFNQFIYDNRTNMQKTKSKRERDRQPWLISHKEDLDFFRIYQFSNQDKIDNLIDNLEMFIRDSKFHPYITIAIAYGQLMMIHPWYYANNRTVGALVPGLFDFYKLTSENYFYINGIFRKCKDTYFQYIYELLMNDSWNQWIIFFLKAIKEQAIRYQEIVDLMEKYYQNVLNECFNVYFTDKIMEYVHNLLLHPIFSMYEINSIYNYPNNLLNPYISHMIDVGIVDKDNIGRKINYLFTGLYAFMEL